jgi:hypothetical protein
VRSRPRTVRSDRWGKVLPSRSSRAALRWMIPLVVVAFLAGLLLGRPVAAITAPPRDEVAELIAQDIRRDSAQIESLTAQARRIHAGLLPVLNGLPATNPASTQPVATREQVAAWHTVTKGFVGEFVDRPSAGTSVNIARSGLAASVQQLDLAVATYAQALDAPDRANWLTTSARQRDIGVVTWSVAATQLDVLNIDSGRGHVHLFLPSQPGQGALTSDGAPEGPR